MKYFIIENNQQKGPFSLYELKEKGLASDTLVWTEGMKDWTPAWQVDELKNFLYNTTSTSTPPPIPPMPAQPATESIPQNPPQQQSSPRKKPTRILFGGIIAMLALFLFLSNPNKEDHQRAIQEQIAAALEQQFSSDDPLSQGMAILGNILVRKITEPVIDNLLTYHNYVFFSTTTIRWNGKEHKASYGMLGHVFTINEDDITKRLEKGKESLQEKNREESSEDADDTYVQSLKPQEGDLGSHQSEGRSLDEKVMEGLGDLVKDKVKEHTDSTTGQGLSKIVDEIMALFKKD